MKETLNKAIKGPSDSEGFKHICERNTTRYDQAYKVFDVHGRKAVLTQHTTRTHCRETDNLERRESNRESARVCMRERPQIQNVRNYHSPSSPSCFAVNSPKRKSQLRTCPINKTPAQPTAHHHAVAFQANTSRKRYFSTPVSRSTHQPIPSATAVK
jgi:hypothetical protein